jgi:hypothetical protein
MELSVSDDRRKNDNYGMVLLVVWVLVALLLAKTTSLGLPLSGVIGLVCGWLIASRLK